MGNVGENQNLLNSSNSEYLIFVFDFISILLITDTKEFNSVLIYLHVVFLILRDRDYWKKLFYKKKGKFLNFVEGLSTAPVLKNQEPQLGNNLNTHVPESI